MIEISKGEKKKKKKEEKETKVRHGGKRRGRDNQ
jgi:hypothetical protein